MPKEWASLFMSIGAINATCSIGMHWNALPVDNVYFLLYTTQDITHEKHGHDLKTHKQLLPFEGERLERAMTNLLAPISQRQAPRFPHGCWKYMIRPYTHYDWVDYRW
jgi:hypothetical protein